MRSTSRLVSRCPPASILVLSRARIRSPVPAWFPSASGARGCTTVPIVTSWACTRRASSAASSFDPASKIASRPVQVIRQPRPRGAVIGRLPVIAPDPPAPVIGRDHGEITGPEPDRGVPLPVGGEPEHLGQLGRAQLADQRGEHAARLDRAELERVPGGHDQRPGAVRVVHDQGEIRGGDHARLIQHQHVPGGDRDRVPQQVRTGSLPQERRAVVDLGQALGRHLPGRVLRGGDPDDPAPGQRRPGARVGGDRVRLACARGSGQDGHRGGAGQQPDRRVLLLRVRSDPARARRAMPSLTLAGTCRLACRRIRSSRST